MRGPPSIPQVTVTTSGDKGASTDAAVSLVLIGSTGSSGPHTLDNGSPGQFKRGARAGGGRAYGLRPLLPLC